LGIQGKIWKLPIIFRPVPNIWCLSREFNYRGSGIPEFDQFGWPRIVKVAVITDNGQGRGRIPFTLYLVDERTFTVFQGDGPEPERCVIGFLVGNIDTFTGPEEKIGLAPFTFSFLPLPPCPLWLKIAIANHSSI